MVPYILTLNAAFGTHVNLNGCVNLKASVLGAGVVLRATQTQFLPQV